MVWGCITSRGMGKLIFIEGRMDANQFIDVLFSEHGATLEMHRFKPNDVTLQQDNDPKHKANVILAEKEKLFTRNSTFPMRW